MGWYQVYEDGTEASMPYNFNDPVEGPMELRAMWRLEDSYYVQYEPCFLADDGHGSVTEIVGEMDQWTDPKDPATHSYADQSPTHILRAPTNVTEGWVFRGWRVVKPSGTTEYEGKTYINWEPIQFDTNGDPVYYQPGDNFTIDSALVSEKPEGGNGSVIHMQAYYESVDSTYRKPDVMNLILDSNDLYGSGYVNTSESSDLPALAGSGSTAINKTTELYEGHPTQILLGDIQSNLALHLYRYATTKTYNDVPGTNFFTSDEEYLLIGFDENADPDNPKTGEAYVPTFAADSVAAVTRKDHITL